MRSGNTAPMRDDDVGREPESLSLLASSAAGIVSLRLESDRVYVIGRTPEADIFLDDGSISRRHALLRTNDGQLTLEDLGSTNGTRVRGVSLRPGQLVRVEVGAVLEVGHATLLIQRPPVPSGRAPAAETTRPPPPDSHADPLGGGIERAPAMRRLKEMLGILAPTSLNVVILGETGVGKEVFAEELHRRSARAEKQFLRLNCGALPESVLEGELFGYERGSFTGAVQARPGLFESADGGTVFLDEIGEMPQSTQAKLLRVLESGEVLRIGSRQPKIVDVRFIAATNRDLLFLIAGGSFRQDLYFRLNGISVVVPPLRDRKENVLELTERFLAASAAKTLRRPPTLCADAARLLEEYSWPGNVRQLQNIVERAFAFVRGSEITAEDLCRFAPELGSQPVVADGADEEVTGVMSVVAPASPSGTARAAGQGMEPACADKGASLRSQRDAFEKDRIVLALAKTAGNQTRAAELLGISRRTLVTKLEQYEVERPRKG